MDENILLSAFSASLGSDNEARGKAHIYLQEIRSAAGLIPILAKISLEPTNNLELRQVAVIFLKNLAKNWKDSNNEFAIPQADKDFLKFHILSALDLAIPEKIRSQFEEIANNLAKIEYPWDEIHSQIAAALDNPSQIYAGLNMIYQISKNFEYVMSEKRMHLLKLVGLFFGKVLELMKNLMGFANGDSYWYVQMILQIYWVSFYIDLPVEQAATPVLDQWLQCFKVVLEVPMGELQNKPASVNEEKVLEKLPQWMCKKWSIQIVHRFFTRYFNLTHLKDQNFLIGQHFQAVWASEFFKIVIPQLFQVREVFIPSLVLNYYLKYTCQSVKFPSTFSLFDENSISHLLINVIMPVLYRVQSDNEIWIENPIEFIRKEADLGKAYYSPKSSAIDLLLVLCDKGILIKFYEYITRELQTSSDLLQKEALLLALGSLSEQIKQYSNKQSEIKNAIEIVLTQFVYCDFTSPIGFLRSRAAWTYSRFALFPFENENFKTQGLAAICQLLLDADLPVRYEASLALPKLLKWDTSKARLSGELKNVLEIYLKLMNEIDSEDVVEALESVISMFPKEIIPFALELTQHLASAFSRMIEKDMNDDEGESAMAAVSTLNTIGKIIDVLEDRPEDLLKVSIVLVPIFNHCLSEKGCDYFEESLNLLTCLLYYAPDQSLPHLYHLLQLLRFSILGNGKDPAYAIEHIDETFSPIANFIKKYKPQTMENMAGILDMAVTLLKDKEQESIAGCKILITVLENFKGEINGFLPQVIENLSKTFENGSKKVKIHCSQAMLVTLWNSPLITLSAGPLVSPSLQFSLAAVKYFKESMARSQMIYGLGSLFFIIPQLPPSLQGTLPAVFKTIVQLCQDSDDESSADAEEFEDGKKGVSLDAQCQKILDKIRAIGPEDSDEEGDFPFATDAEDLYDSPFEVMNQNQFIKEIVEGLTHNYPELITSINALLSETEAKLLTTLIQ